MAKKNPANPAPSRPRSQVSNPPLQGDLLPLLDAPAGHTTLPDDVAALVSVISTNELSRRPSRPPNHAAENRALIALAEEMANSPHSILQNLVETALHLCRAHTAGISLLEDGQRRFYWPAIAGQWAVHVGGDTPREYGPCGTVLDCNTALLFSHPERDFDYLAPVTPSIEEALLIPFYVQGKAVGTIWVIAHDKTRQFDAEDYRIVTSLGRFAASAYQLLQNIEERKRADEAQARLAAIVESSDDAIISKNLNGIITAWNGAAERIFGYTAAEAIGKHIVLIVPPELQQEEQSILERLRHGESIEHYETVRVAHDGRRFHVSLTISPVRDATGRVVGASKVAREIDDRKQADAMMLGQKQAFEMAINGAPINDVLQVLVRTAQAPEGIARSAIFIVDTDGAHLRFAAAAGMPETYTSAVDGFNIGPEFPSCGMAAYTGKAVIVPDVAQDPLWAPYLDPAQRHQICACWSFPILSRGGKVLGTFAVYHDHPREPDPRDLQSINLLAQTAAVLIERHNAAQEREYVAESLRESEERFRFLADNAPVLIWVNGLEGCEFVNREYLRFLGCTFNDVLEMAWSRFIHPDDVEGYLAAYLCAFERREPFDAQVRLRRADGEYRWMRAVGAPRFTPGGAFVGYVGCSADITDVKRSEDDLKQADQRKDEFLAMLGHELRNPLAAISTGATLLRQNPTEERRAWIEQMMFRQIGQLQRLVDDLLDVTRITRGKIQLRKQQLDLRKHIDAAVEAVAPLVQKHGHQLSVSLPDEAAFLHADPARFEQILVNLLTNAVKYTPEGGKIHLSAELIPSSSAEVVACHSEDAPCLPAQGGQAAAEESQPQFSRKYQPVARPTANRQSEGTHRELCPTSPASQSAHHQVVIRCRDTGAGIAPEALEHIFEPFVQFHAALDRSDSGLGMGLALVKRLAELHGGTVTAASDGPGRGSEFTVRLPLLAPEDVRPSQPTAEITATLPSEDALRVLVVDDNLDYAEGIAILLRAAGHSVSLAHHGEAGLLAAMREPPPDIILLDLGLPGLDGYTVAERLRSPEIAARMKAATIVAVSGFSPKNAAKGRPNFFDAQLVKPIAHADLLGLLQEKLAARKAAVSPLASHRILLIEDNQEIALLTAELLRNRGLQVEVAFDGADGIEKANSFRPHAVLCDMHLPDMTGFDVAQRLRAASELARQEDPSAQPPLLVAVTAFSADPLPARVDRGPFDHFMSKPLDWAELNRLLNSSEKKSMAVARST